MTKKVLIISNEQDAHIPFVLKHLQEEPIILDVSKVSKDTTLSYIQCTNKTDILYKGYNLQNIHSVWYRKPHFNDDNYFLNNLQINTDYVRGCRNSYNALFKSLLDLLQNKTWISNPQNILKASNKVYQMDIARSLGFLYPETLITNDYSLAQTFLKKHSNNVVIKNYMITNIMPKIGEKIYMPTTKFSENIRFNWSTLYFSPVIFQQIIPNKVDIRVCVIGDKIYSTLIESKQLDWRSNPILNKPNYSRYKLPIDLENNCRSLVHKLGLKFGAIDFVYDGENYYFLEINPNGQWAFIEEEVGYPLSKEVANLLIL